MTFLPMIAIFVVFYFLLIRPQQKRAKEHEGDARGAAEGRRGRHRRRHRRQDRQADRAVRDGRNRAERRDHRAARGRSRSCCPRARSRRSRRRRRPARPPAVRRPRSARPAPPALPPPTLTAARHESLSRSGSTWSSPSRWSIGVLYTLPNFFPEVPAVQVSARRRRRSRSTPRCWRTVEDALKAANDPLPRRGARRHRHQGPLRRHRHADQGQGRAAGEARRQLHRRAEPAVVVAAVADGDRRAADVPRPRPARRRALPAAGRHEGGARQGRRPLHDRHPLAAAREEGPVRRRRPRGPQRRHPLPRRGRAHEGARRDREGFPDLALREADGARRRPAARSRR